MTIDGQDLSLHLWVEEKFRGFLAQKYRVKRSIFSEKSPFQKVDVVETEGHGLMLLLDGMVMLSERDEFVYHDMISHVPLFIHPNPKRVLVIGGGDGGTIREVLRHVAVERAWMVEIDGMVVDVCRRYLPVTSCALDDPRLTLLIEDGVKFMAETEERFDVVLIDSTDPVGPAKPLFGEAFYRNVHRVLNPDGIAIAQGESPFYDRDVQRGILQSMSASFPRLHMYNYSNLTYPGGLWTFVYASKGLCPLGDFDPGRIAAAGLEFRYYNQALHRGAFALPQFQLQAFQDYLSAFKS